MLPFAIFHRIVTDFYSPHNHRRRFLDTKRAIKKTLATIKLNYSEWKCCLEAKRLIRMLEREESRERIRVQEDRVDEACRKAYLKFQ